MKELRDNLFVVWILVSLFLGVWKEVDGLLWIVRHLTLSIH